MAETDSQLLARYRRGDAGAFEALVEKYRRPLFSFILNMTGGQTDADDVFQDVWFRAIRSIDRYKEGNFFGWLARIAHNLVIDRSRRRQADASLDEEPVDGMPLGEAIPSPSPTPAKEIEKKDLIKKLQAAVATLPEEQKEVFLMRIQADLPFKEIAKIQKVSINTALARMQYALAKVRPLLGEYDTT